MDAPRVAVRDPVVCTRLRAVLSAAACARRCAACYPSGRRRGRPRFYPCATCPVGARVLPQLERRGWVRPPDSLPGVVLGPEQRAARLAWARTFPSYAAPRGEQLDPFVEAALVTPDDRGIGAAG